MIEEIWKPIIGYEEKYEVSNQGRVRSLDRLVNQPRGTKRIFPGRILKPRIDSLGKYLRFSLCKEGTTKDFSNHRLVATAFCENLNNYPEVNHKNGNTKDNEVSNLEWVNRSQNIQHSYDIGIRKGTILTREQCHLSKLTSSQVLEVISLRDEGVKYKHIAEKFSMSISALERIISKNKKKREYDKIRVQESIPE